MILLPSLLTLTLLGAGPTVPQVPGEALSLMLQARAKQRRGGGSDPSGAVALYRKALALQPDSAEAHLRLSEALLEEGNLEGAVAPAVKATELAPRSADAWANLGILHSIRARKSPAILVDAQRALRRAAALMPTDPELWARLAEVAEARKDDATALLAWTRVGRLRPPFAIQGRSLEAYAWERSALLATALGNYEARREATLALARSARPEPRHLRLLEDLAREQVDKGYLGHAEESFQLLGTHLAEEPAVWENVAIIQIRTFRFEEAMTSLARAEASRRTLRSEYHAALTLMNLGRVEESLPRWRSVVTQPAQDEEARLQENGRFLLGTALLLSDHPQAVLDHVTSGWPGADAIPEAQGLRFQALVRLERWTEARDLLRRGMSAWPRSGVFQLAAALPPASLEGGIFSRSTLRKTLQQLDQEVSAGLWAEFRQWNPCLGAVRAVRKLAPVPRVDLILLEANALQELGRPAQALEVLREGQRMAPEHPMLQNNLGYLLLEQGGDLAEASALIEAALKQEPKNGSTMDSWGWALYKQGRLAEAEEALRKAAELQPFNPEIRKHHGEALLRMGREQEALEQWERALAYAFPDRRALEDRARALRASLALKQRDHDAEGEAQDQDAPLLADDPEDPS